MDAQQQQVFKFSQEMESSSTAQTSSIPTPTVTGVTITPVYKEPHVLDRVFQHQHSIINIISLCSYCHYKTPTQQH